MANFEGLSVLMIAAINAGHSDISVHCVGGSYRLCSVEAPLIILGESLAQALDFVNHESFSVRRAGNCG